jgi:flavin reductase (DIM6/NTAB) family NADH-FMN oxidoreductase RutF
MEEAATSKRFVPTIVNATPADRTHAAAATGGAAAAGIIHDARRLRSSFGHFATGVTVVSFSADGGPRGATVNSFTSVSLDPPLLLVSLARTARACAALPDRPFVVNVLAEDQLDLALHFAGRTRPGFEVPWVDGTDVPRLRGTVAWFECKPWASYEGGDHVLYVGEIVHYDSQRARPLLFYTGDFRSAGLALYELPRIVPLDGRPIADWFGPAHRLHELGESGHHD